MNENAKALYEDLAATSLPDFDMASWCDTAHCIGGEATIRMRALGLPVNGLKHDLEGEWLGLAPEVAEELFYPPDIINGPNKQYQSWSPWAFMGTRSAYKATQPEAAEALKRACEMSEAK